MSAPARAEVPRVTVDIPPVHSLVARVMDGLGEPDLVVRPNASPHDYAMRTSEALALERSDVIFRTSDVLTPWLVRRIDALAPDTLSVELMSVPDTRRLARRTGATFAAHEHGDHEGHAGNEEHEEHEEHEDDHASGEEGYDPHGWLDPVNASLWLGAIADTLADVDPDNAARYRENAAAGRADLDALVARTAERLSPIGERTFITFHDSFHYFESRFGVHAAGALSPDDASDPGPARVREVRDTIERLDVGCVFAEPQFDPVRVTALVDGLPVAVGTLDPIGATLEPGAALYGELIEDVAEAMLDCLAG